MNDENYKIGKADIIDAFHSGKLVDSIFDRFGHLEEKEFNRVIDICVSAHQARELDLLSIITADQLSDKSGGRFFTGQDFFCKIIPRIDASIEEMMSSVQLLIEQGGDDLAAHLPNAAFQEWCEADLTRAQEVISAAKAGNQLAENFLTFALASGRFIEDAEEFVQCHVGQNRLSGITALGRIDNQTCSQALACLSTFREIVSNNHDDDVRINILFSALKIAENLELFDAGDLIEIVRCVCKKSSDNINFASAKSLHLHGKSLPEECVVQLLNPLYSVNPSHKGTLDELDFGLARLLESSHADRSVEFVTKLLTSPTTLKLSQFDSFARNLVQGPQDKFHQVLVDWLLTGERALCEGFNSVLRDLGRSENPIDLPISKYDLTEQQQIFLCRKAIGYFFFQPVIAASILVSVLRSCKGQSSEMVQSLLFDPLLLNYGGAVKSYLESIESNDLAYPQILVALDRGQNYLDGIKSTGRIKELLPSEHQRQIDHIRFKNEMREALKKAEEKSIFMNLVRRSVILYGNRSIFYVDGPGDDRRPVEMDLKSHSSEIEIPRSQIADPVGLEYMLRAFRAEKLQS